MINFQILAKAAAVIWRNITCISPLLSPEAWTNSLRRSAR